MNMLAWLVSQALSLTPASAVEQVPLAVASNAALAVAPARAKAAPPKASVLLAKVQAFYAAASDLQASYRQVHYRPETAAAAPVTGMIKLRKPGKMILDYDGDTPDVYLNGKDMWQVDPAMKQVAVMKLEEDPSMTAGLGFLFGGKEILHDYLVRLAAAERQQKYGDDQHVVLQLKPRKHNEHFKGLILGVHTASGRVDRVIVYGHDGSTNQFDLSGAKVNSGLGEDLFAKKIPEGYVEVDAQL